jgi:tetratricopeptide (TPR) repeat protein
MKRIVYLISMLLISFAGYSQKDDQIAKEYFNSGCDKVSRKNYKGAIADFSEAIMRTPGFKQAYENRGVAKYYLLDLIGAVDDFTKALEIDPNDYNTYGRRGWAKFHLQDYRGAVTDFTKAIKGSRDSLQYYNIRGQVKYLLQNYEGAIADLNKVIKSWSVGKNQKSKAFYFRGLSEIDMGQKDSGCLDLSKAAKSGYIKASEAIKQYCQ